MKYAFPTKTDWQVAALAKIPPNLRARAGYTVPIDAAINLRAQTYNRYLEQGNACAVLRMVRRRGEPLLTYLQWAANEYRNIQPKRAFTYRRWYRRAMEAST